MNITCIIPTGNSFAKKWGCIKHTLLAVFLQTVVSEVIVVHNGIEEDLNQLSDFLSTHDKNNIGKIIYSPWINIPQSRNIWAKASNGDLLLFLDDDTILEDIYMFSFIQKNILHYDFAVWAKRYRTTSPKRFIKNTDMILSKMLTMNTNSHFLNLFEKDIWLWNKSHRKNGWEFLLSRTFIGSLGVIKKDWFSYVWQFPEDFNSFDDDIIMFNLLRKWAKGASLFNKSVVHVNHIRNYDNNSEEDCLRKFIEYISYHGMENYCTLEEMAKLEKESIL